MVKRDTELLGRLRQAQRDGFLTVLPIRQRQRGRSTATASIFLTSLYHPEKLASCSPLAKAAE